MMAVIIFIVLSLHARAALGCSIPSPTLGYDKVRADASVARQTLRNHGSLYHESCQSREEAKKSCEPKQLPPIVDPAARAKTTESRRKYGH
jgi:hypothetical protein